MFRVCIPSPQAKLRMVAGTGGVTKGALCALDTATAVETAEGVSTAVILGVACETVAAGAVATIDRIGGKEIEADIYQGGATDVFTDANLGTLYDIYVDTHNFYIDPNDTSGGFCQVTRYDNDAAKAYIIIPDAYIYIS